MAARSKKPSQAQIALDTRQDAIYARQSIDKKDSISIETQIDHATKEAGEGAVLRRPYVDKGKSGKDMNRPALQRLLKDMEKDLIRRVIVYRLDRFSRSLLDFASMMQLFAQHDVAFVSTKEKFDTSTAIGKAMLSIVMVFAQLERETLQERITDNFHARVEQGWGMGGVAPYGLRREPITHRGIHTKVFVGKEPEISVLRGLFEQYAKTKISLNQLTAQLNESNIPSPGASLWDSSKISRLLHNPIYVKADADIYRFYKAKGATMINDMEEFDGEHSCYLYGKWDRSKRKFADFSGLSLALTLSEGHVDSETFLRVQAKLDENRQLRRSGQSKHSWLSGLTKCGKCGYTMTVSSNQKGSSTRKVFICRGRTLYHACEGHSRVFHIAEVEAVVEHRLLENIREKRGLQLVQQAQTDARATQYKLSLAKLDEQIDNLLQAIADGDPLAVKYVKPRLAELDGQRAELEKRYNAYRYRTEPSLPRYPIADIEENWDTLTLEQKKEIAAIFIEKILFFDDGLEIIWRHHFDPGA